MLVDREKGVALVAAIFTILFVTVLISLLMSRSLGEIKTSRDDTAITQTLLLARAGANIGSALLYETVRPELNRIVKDKSSSTSRWAFDPYNTTGTAPNPTTTAANLAIVADAVQTAIHTEVCTRNQNHLNANGGQVAIRIYFTANACGVALPNGVQLPAARFYEGEPRNATGMGLQTYALPFVLVAEGSRAEHRRNVVIQGEYIVQIGRSSFARYGYFSNIEKGDDGGLIYFTDQTMIDGPVHTNQQFALAYDPWFGGEVTSAGCDSPSTAGTQCSTAARNPGATFYGQRVCTRFNRDGSCASFSGTASAFVKQSDMRPNDQNPSYALTTPIFGNGVAWDAAYVPLPPSSDIQKRAAAGKDADNRDLPNIGLTFTSGLETLEFRIVSPTGSAATARLVNGKPVYADNTEMKPGDPKFQIIKACTATRCDIYRVDNQGVMMQCTPTVTTSADATPGTTLPVKSSPSHNNDITEEQCFSSKWNADNRYAEGSARNPWRTVTTAAKPFNGVIYVNGEVKRYKGPNRATVSDQTTAPPAIAAFSQLTVAAENNIRVTGDLKYERSPCSGNPVRNSNRSVTSAVCNDLDSIGILGTYSAQGSITVGNGNTAADLNAPNNVHVHSILMAGKGKVEVENFSSGGSRGTFNLLGGMIQNRRGAFGTFSSSGGSGTGFDRVYVYDRRMLGGLAPPHFPTTGTDEVKFIRAVTFGQREQVF